MEHVPLVQRIWQQDYTHFHTNRFKWFRNPPCKALYKLMGLFKYKTESGAAGAKSDLIPCSRLAVWSREGEIYLFTSTKLVAIKETRFNKNILESTWFHYLCKSRNYSMVNKFDRINMRWAVLLSIRICCGKVRNCSTVSSILFTTNHIMLHFVTIW